MNVRIHQIDAFTDRPFCGNPAAVCIVDSSTTDAWMQNVAAEMNLAETAFLVRTDDGYALRWFTPLLEVDLCGHATLASAHMLWDTGIESSESEIRFETKSGILTARRDDDWIELNFPSEPASPAPVAVHTELLLALRITQNQVNYIGSNRMDLLLEIESVAALIAIAPDMVQLAKLPYRGVIVTAKSNETGKDFLSRFFAPAAGVPEDPVTGSAHCCLAPYWQSRLNKDSMVGYQASRRGGFVAVVVQGDRVLLRGKAVTVLRGDLV